MSEANQYLYKLKKESLKLPDMKTIWRIRKGEANDAEIIDWLSQVIEGGVDNIPLEKFPEVWEAVILQFYDLDNPKDKEGKASNTA